MSNFAYTDATETVVWRSNPDGSQESYLVTAVEYQEWLAAGGVPDPAKPPINPALDSKPAKTAAQILGV